MKKYLDSIEQAETLDQLDQITKTAANDKAIHAAALRKAQGRDPQNNGYLKEDTTMTATYTIYDIEALTETQAAKMAEESATIKGHKVYFVDFGGY